MTDDVAPDTAVDDYMTMDVSALLPAPPPPRPAKRQRRRVPKSKPRRAVQAPRAGAGAGAGAKRGDGRPAASAEGGTVGDAAVRLPEDVLPPSLRLSKAEARQQAAAAALDTPLDAGNVGFKMLVKMGYKAGKGVGADPDCGRTEPVQAVVRHGRTGIGMKTALEAKQEARERAFRDALAKARAHVREMEGLQAGFRAQQREVFRVKQVERRLEQAGRQLRELDGRVEESSCAYMWAGNDDDDDGGGGGGGDGAGGGGGAGGCGGGGECGGGDDGGDEAHGAEAASAAAEDVAPVAPDSWTRCGAEERLLMVLHELRTRHLYCMFCGCVFDDGEDMDAHCPGMTAEEHE